MDRHIKQEGIILKNYRIGEYHKGAKVFSPQSGIADFTAYGGYKGKSKLGPLVSPVTSGIFSIYRKSGSKNAKIEEFYPENYFEGIKRDLKKYYAVMAWFEIVIKMHGGGDSMEDLYRLLLRSMEYLENCDPAFADDISIQFLLKTLKMTGFPLDIENCGICGKKIDKSSYVYFQKNRSVILCRRCGTAGEETISSGILKYIEYTSDLDLSAALKISVCREDREQLKKILFLTIQSVLECRLNALSGIFDIF